MLHRSERHFVRSGNSQPWLGSTFLRRPYISPQAKAGFGYLRGGSFVRSGNFHPSFGSFF